MSLTTQTNGANTTVTLTRTGANAKISNVLTDAAHCVWKVSNGDWNTATNAQKLAVLETSIVNYVLELAKSYNITTDLAASKETAEEENIANYDL